ncbi:neutral and basic amino acid transport protein rBAT-like [Agrilus planipennis]|uniref:Neutral and basic amino acid transport protein rBAT-like n=1 Tax=Agrilus planipennis TaxID=224129 RepID=A0A1W4XB62_AGRPL|nr:neutral and basic amino acid transport protein rBAT-like [Agrilus planipennis]
MEGLLRVQNPVTARSYLGDDTTSTCALITPSPPTNALINPLPEEQENIDNYINPDELAIKLKHMKDIDQSDKKSTSSSNCSLAEPPSTTLLNNHYLHMPKDENIVTQEAPGKVQPLQMTFKNPPENYFFMKWNWILIRKISAWMFLSIMVAMLGIVIAMIWTLPKKCNPVTQWYQGNLMYEVFPASFPDTNGDGIGDFKGLSLKANYLKSLGVRILRLNSIFVSKDYPDDYKNNTSLTKIATPLGDIKDFAIMVNTMHTKNISLVLDLPLWPYLKKLGHLEEKLNLNSTNAIVDDPVGDITEFWLEKGVDGFFLQGIEHFANSNDFPKFLRRWKKIVGQDKILIIDEAVLNVAPKSSVNTIYMNVDLVKVNVPIEEGTLKLSNFFSSIFNSTLFSKANMPWILWTLGDESSVRMADRLPYKNGTLGATLLQMMLPGTPCIFYGDEIGLTRIIDLHGDRKDVEHLHHLAPMKWEQTERQFTRKDLLPWNHGIQATVSFNQLELISKAVILRSDSPAIYLNSINRDGVNKANAEVKYANDEIMVLHRWYPRRKSYVVLSNLGKNRFEADLSKYLYSGEIIIGPTPESKLESLSFKNISLWPGESVIVFVN